MQVKQNRNTAQRRLVRGLLENNFSHPTADEIYELARKKNPTISRGTVYRNLNLLAESGEIIKIMMPLGPDHYDVQTNHHYHFLCRICNCIIDTNIPYNSELNLVTPNLPGCKTEWHKLILVGLCPACNNE